LNRFRATQPRGAAVVVPLAFSFALVAFMTLRPTRAIVATPTFCVFCGSLGGVDFILNVILFVPLGVTLQWATGRFRTTALLGVATTLVIETLQARLITGRDASLGDLIANTLGTLLGAWLGVAVFRWLNASAPAARRHAARFGVVVSLVVVVSAFLLQPLVPRYPQWVQWTPLRPNTDPFEGHLIAVHVKGRTIYGVESFEAREAFDPVARSLSMRAQIGPGPARPSQRQAIIARITNGKEEGFYLAQWGNAAAFRTHMAAALIRLRPLLVGLKGAFSDSSSRNEVGELVIEGHSDPRGITVRRHSDEVAAVSVRRTVGLAWAMISPRDIALNERWWLANAAWLAVLIFPVSFFAVRGQRPADTSRAKSAWWPVALVLATLIAVPATGLSPLAIGEWTGILVGISAGWVLERWSAPPRDANVHLVDGGTP
jgi:glycopeptide antibiotics resistance protein